MQAPEPKTTMRLTPRLIGLGASTGGPLAIAKALAGVTPQSGLVVLLVQHLAPHFVPSFVDWLTQHVALPVRIAKHGDHLEGGVVFVAAEDHHLELSSVGTLALTTSPPLHACRPAVDALFLSLAQHARYDTLGILLTGIGDDGAQGLKAMRTAGMRTIAQDEASSVVFGMPKAAVELQAAERVMSLEAIAAMLHGLAHGRAA